MQTCYDLALMPHRGTVRDDMRGGIRTLGFERKVTVYFKVVGDQVLITM